jgi:uncharacterized protein YacL (UPF0231 family)
MRTLKTIILISMVFFVHLENSAAQANSSSSTGEKRLALVIGNGKYINSNELPNPVNDARAMRDALQKVGFEVSEYENLNQGQIKKAIDDFGTKLKQYNIGLFYYAGHGIQSRGANYLIPVDANIQNEQQIEYDCVQADRILGLMEAAGSKINIVILDACRNNPFSRSWSRSMDGSGLAFMNAPTGSLIAYSTSPGRTASDGSGSNGLYTAALLENIKTPNITILQMFQNVRRSVSDKSTKTQIPWESTSLTSDFYFVNNTSGTNARYDIAENQTYSNNPVTFRSMTNATWKHDEKIYSFYINGEEVSARLVGSWSEADWLVFDPVTKNTFLCENYNTRVLNQVYPAKDLGNASDAWWRLDSVYYHLYVKGENVGVRTKRFSIDNDLLVFDEATNTTYIFKDFTTSHDNQFRPAPIFDNAEFAFWRRVDNTFWLYVKGEEIQYRTKFSSTRNDLLVYDEPTNITYLLDGYYNESNKALLKPARVISYMDNTLWMKTGNEYWVFLKGEMISNRTTTSWSGNDLLVTDTTTYINYILPDYVNATENQLRPVVTIAKN